MEVGHSLISSTLWCPRLMLFLAVSGLELMKLNIEVKTVHSAMYLSLFRACQHNDMLSKGAI